MSAVQIIVWVTLGIAWALIPTVVILYRLIVAPARYEEIKLRFVWSPEEGAPPLARPTTKSAALHYARLLDPDIEAEATAEKLLEDHFWYFHSWRRYLVPLLIVGLLSGAMLWFSGLWIEDRLAGGHDGDATPLGRVNQTIVMALWGAFVWSVYEILSRRKSGDLTPIEVYDVAQRFIVAIPIGYAFSLLVFQTVPALAAFIASAFPLRDVRQLLRKNALEKLGENTQRSEALVSKGYVGEVLSGVGHGTIVRLEELNIETYLDLAYTDPIRLMVKTGAPIQEVLAWVDQALLAVYAAPLKAKFEDVGMPCALDVREFYMEHCFDSEQSRAKDKWRENPAIQALATQLGVPLDLLPQLLSSIADDPHVQFLDAAWYGPAGRQAAPPMECLEKSPKS